MQASLTPTELRAVLADIGATPAAVDTLLAGLDEATLTTARCGWALVS